MGWLLAICTTALVAAIWFATATIVRMLDALVFQVAWLRKETKAGLGVDSNDQHGYADGGFLREMADDLRKRRKAEREERRDYGPFG